MADTFPDLHFRVRENGAAVYRVDLQNRNKRMDLEHIAAVNLRNGEIKPTGKAEITDAEQQAMQEWLTARKTILAEREMEDIRRAIEQIGTTAHWVQTKATPEQLEDITDQLLLSLFDLRQILVRKKSERMSGR